MARESPPKGKLQRNPNKSVDKLAQLQAGSNQFAKKVLPTGRTSSKGIPELAKELKVGATTVGKLRIINRNKDADPEISTAVDTKEITIDAGYEVQRLPKDQQAEALTRVKKQKSGFYAGRRTRKKTSSKPQPIRPGEIKFPTAEETGLPVNGSMFERDAHHRKYGRTPLHPKAIADILKHSEVLSGYVTAIQVASSDNQPSTQQLFEAVDAMLAWVPDKAKGEQWATNYAAKAAKQLARLEERLPILINRLLELQEILAARHDAQR